MHDGRRQLDLLRREAADHRQPRVRRRTWPCSRRRASGRSSRTVALAVSERSGFAVGVGAGGAGDPRRARAAPLPRAAGVSPGRRWSASAGETLVNFSSNDYLGLAAVARRARRGHRGASSARAWARAPRRLVVGDTTAHQRAGGTRSPPSSAPRPSLLFNTRLRRQHRHHPGAGRLGGRRVLRRAQPRLARRRLPAVPRAQSSSTRTRTSRRSPGRSRETPARRKLVVTDTVFSMDGDCGAAARACRGLRGAHGAALLVDEAHATGVLGARGAGLCEELGLEAAVDVRMGTLGKALGLPGRVRGHLSRRWRTCCSTARARSSSPPRCPPAVCAAAEAAVEHGGAGRRALRARLWRNIRRFAEGPARAGAPRRGAQRHLPRHPRRARSAPSTPRAAAGSGACW